MPSKALQLRNITACAIDCITPQLAARALEISANRADFEDIVLITDKPISWLGRTVLIPTLTSREAYSNFVLRDLIRFTESPHTLVVQWDGYVLHTSAWRDQFTAFDYIGAPWPWFNDGMNIGNGGFSLRSRRLMEATSKECESLPLNGENEDLIICRALRPRLEQQIGLRFADSALASAFSYERAPPLEPTFGFHGLFNFWRHVDDAEMLHLAGQLPPSTLKGREYLELLLVYLQLGKFEMLGQLFERALTAQTSNEMATTVAQITADSAMVNRLLTLGSRMTTR
jgi:hypothetical protein